MINIQNLIKVSDKLSRQFHLKLNESCVERGGCSTHFKGVLAEYLQTTIPHGRNDKVFLCHACHNDKCSNPKHLYWGTPSENVHDAIKNGNPPGCKKGHQRTPRSNEIKQKISTSLKNRPSNNPLGLNGNGTKGKIYKRHYKQMWITNGIKETRIKFDAKIPSGFIKGRMLAP